MLSPVHWIFIPVCILLVCVVASVTSILLAPLRTMEAHYIPSQGMVQHVGESWIATVRLFDSRDVRERVLLVTEDMHAAERAAAQATPRYKIKEGLDPTMFWIQWTLVTLLATMLLAVALWFPYVSFMERVCKMSLHSPSLDGGEKDMGAQ